MKNLKSLASMVESCDDEFLKFDLEYQQVPQPYFLFTRALDRVLIKEPNSIPVPSNQSRQMFSVSYKTERNFIHENPNIQCFISNAPKH